MSNNYIMFFKCGSGRVVRRDSGLWEKDGFLFREKRGILVGRDQQIGEECLEIYRWFMLRNGERMDLYLYWDDWGPGEYMINSRGKLPVRKALRMRYEVDVARECDQDGNPFTTTKYFSQTVADRAQRARRNSLHGSKYNWDDFRVGEARRLPTGVTRTVLINNFKMWARRRDLRERLVTHTLDGQLIGTRMPLDPSVEVDNLASVRKSAFATPADREAAAKALERAETRNECLSAVGHLLDQRFAEFERTMMAKVNEAMDAAVEKTMDRWFGGGKAIGSSDTEH